MKLSKDEFAVLCGLSLSGANYIHDQVEAINKLLHKGLIEVQFLDVETTLFPLTEEGRKVVEMGGKS
jgi:hypothetical protein